jgi:hypothetical protein
VSIPELQERLRKAYFISIQVPEPLVVIPESHFLHAGDVFHGRIMVAMLHASVPEFQFRDELIIQFSDVDIVQFVRPLQEGTCVL